MTFIVGSIIIITAGVAIALSITEKKRGIAVWAVVALLGVALLSVQYKKSDAVVKAHSVPVVILGEVSAD